MKDVLCGYPKIILTFNPIDKGHWIKDWLDSNPNKTMETKTKKYKVEIPEGYEAVKTITGTSPSKDGKSELITEIFWKKIKKELPKTWEEHSEEWSSEWNTAIYLLGKNVEPFRALNRLIVLRDVYNDGLEALSNPVSIYRKEKGDKVIMGDCVRGALVLHHDVALEFYTNFRDNLLEQAKPLL